MRLIAFCLVTHDAERLAGFYGDAFGFRRGASRRLSGARAVTLRLGAQRLDLLQFDRPGRLYPPDVSSSDPRFQHLALVAADVGLTYRRLLELTGWSPISVGGPQRLPASSGGVTAFKFRDPEGHPLELLGFPPGEAPAPWEGGGGDGAGCLGIDHSAIVVRDIPISRRFYEALGLGLGVSSLNQGPEQARLDGLDAPVVDVVALEPDGAPPHVELLAYRPAAPPPTPGVNDNDVAATQLVFEAAADAEQTRALFDPDGHRLLIAPGEAAEIFG